jgi:hypothetical protein
VGAVVKALRWPGPRWQRRPAQHGGVAHSSEPEQEQRPRGERSRGGARLVWERSRARSGTSGAATREACAPSRSGGHKAERLTRGRWSGGSSGRWDGVEIVITISMKHHASGWDILDRKTKSIKFNETIVIASKLANG